MLRRLAKHLKPGGLILFQEPTMLISQSLPRVDLFERCRYWYMEGLRAGGARSTRLTACAPYLWRRDCRLRRCACTCPSVLDQRHWSPFTISQIWFGRCSRPLNDTALRQEQKLTSKVWPKGYSETSRMRVAQCLAARALRLGRGCLSREFRSLPVYHDDIELRAVRLTSARDLL